MKTLEEFQSAIGKTFTVSLGETQHPITLDAVEVCTPLEGDIPDGVNRNPFTLIFKSPLDVRLPDDTHKVTSEELGELDLYLDCCSGHDQVTEHLTYESHIG